MKKLDRNLSFPQIEAELIKYWDKHDIFTKSVKARKGKKKFVFYDGPPFASGEPHYGHVEQSALKDTVARYQTMRGRYVPRRVGFDTHGLPVEFLVEKELGLKTKQDIIKLGIDKFNEACRKVVFRHRDDFYHMFTRLGRWYKEEESYATLDDTYIESIWWVFSEIYKKGLVYRGFKSIAYCPRCATPLSNFEVNDGYRDNVSDPSVFVTFPLADDPKTAFLAWTTTPWTLPANAALAIDPKADYVTVKVKGGDKLILAKARLDVLDLRKQDYKVVKTHKGKQLVGIRYEPLYNFAEVTGKEKNNVHKVYSADVVSLEDGTGILHVAPAFGEEDLNLGLKHQLPITRSVDGNGNMTDQMGEFAGLFFKEADPHIIADLTKKERIFAAETFTHTYPFCWRCETPLLYYAIDTWFVEVTKFKESLVKAGKETNWIPAHIKTGRFVKWLEGARDWAISRNRFWGAPIPVWQCSAGHFTPIGSIDELRKKAVNIPKTLDMHRPGIDRVVIKCEECGREAGRIEEVFDCWFESGSMPYGQDHYPFENKKEFEDNYPADFIAEALEQVHLWFYTLHVLSVALFNKPSYRDVVASGLILAADGKKLSKRLRNYPAVDELFDEFGADSLRYFLLSSPLMSGEPARLSKDAVSDVMRNVFMIYWNTALFYQTYAQHTGFEPSGKPPRAKNLLDRWILARLNETTDEMTKYLDRYEISRAARLLAELVNELSTWYVKTSRKRFTKDNPDYQSAFETFHYALSKISQLMAPFSPFLPDYVYQALTDEESVHLSDWPKPVHAHQDDALLKRMGTIRELITQGLSQRAEAKIKVRQPLSKVDITSPIKLSAEEAGLVAGELNVKEVVSNKGDLKVKLDTKLTAELRKEGSLREVIRHVQNLRKSLGLNVGQKIVLKYQTPSAHLRDVIEQNDSLIKKETGLKDIIQSDDVTKTVPVRSDGEELFLGAEDVL